MAKDGHTLVVGAYDIAPCIFLEALVKCWEGVSMSLLAHAKRENMSEALDVRECLKDADVLVVGMSSNPEAATYELMLIETADELGVPVALVADTYGVALRPHFEHIRGKISLVMVIDQHAAEEACAAYPREKIAVVGDPRDFAYTTKTVKGREAVRRELGVGEHERLIQMSLSKTAPVNCEGIVYIMGAAARLRRESDIIPLVVLCPHPGAQDHMPDVYDFFVRHSPVPGMVEVVTKESMPSNVVVEGADLVIDRTGSLQRHAMFRGIPTILLFTELGVLLTEEETGSHIWPPAQFGTGWEVKYRGRPGNSIRDLYPVMREFLLGGGQRLRTLQENRQKALPPEPPQEHSAALAMQRAILGLL